MKYIKEDLNLKKQMKKILKQAAEKAFVAVGIVQDKPHDKKFTIVDLATVHEFGSSNGHIPARSFIRSTCDANQTKYLDKLKKLEKAYFESKLTLKQALSQMGALVSSDMRQNINAGNIKPPLKPKTIKRKKSSKPLIDTGRLKGAISYEVRDV
jgi:phage gpG-like protein